MAIGFTLIHQYALTRSLAVVATPGGAARLDDLIEDRRPVRQILRRPARLCPAGNRGLAHYGRATGEPIAQHSLAVFAGQGRQSFRVSMTLGIKSPVAVTDFAEPHVFR